MNKKIRKITEADLKAMDDVSFDDASMSANTASDSTGMESDPMASGDKKVTVTVTDTGVDISTDSLNLSIDGDIEVIENGEGEGDMEMDSSEEPTDADDELEVFDGTGDEMEDEEDMDMNSMRDKYRVTRESLNIDADFAKLFDGQTLTEDFKTKTKEIFESVVISKANEQIENAMQVFEEAYTKKLANQVTIFAENIDRYLEQAVSDWFSDNSAQLESTLKADVAESLFNKFAGVLEEAHIILPETKFAALKTEQEKTAKLQTEVNRLLDESRRYKAMIVESRKEKIINTLAEKNSLSLNEKEKLTKLCENVVYKNDKEYTDKVTSVLKDYIVEGKDGKKTTGVLTESIKTNVEQDQNALLPKNEVDFIADYISKMAKN